MLHAAHAPDFYLHFRTLGSVRGRAARPKRRAGPYRDDDVGEEDGGVPSGG
jgi:hypothetical protein